jgi:ubiquitin-like protein Nedd8
MQPECPVCLEETSKTLCTYQCGHTVCLACHIELFYRRQNNLCSLCRSRIEKVTHSGAIQIFLRFLLGETCVLNLDPQTTVEQMKYAYCDLTGMLMENQRILFNGRQLHDDKTLNEYKIGMSCTVHVALRLRGD